MRALALLIILFSTAAQADFCRLMKDWRKGEFSWDMLSMDGEGKQICEAAGLESCWSIKTTGQAICLAGGGQFCANVTNVSQGICTALGGSQCLQRSSMEDLTWIRLAKQKCDQDNQQRRRFQ